MRTIAELVTILEGTPGKLASARRELSAARLTLAEAKNRFDESLADAIFEASQEVDEKGKAKYSNQAAREQAAHKKLEQNDRHLALAASLVKAETHVSNAQIALSSLEDESKSNYAQLDALVAMLRSEAIQELTKATLTLARYEAGRRETL